VIFGGIMHVRVSAIYRFKLKAAGSFTGKVLEKVAGLAPPIQKTSAAVFQQAHFTALDGTIRVARRRQQLDHAITTCR